MPGGAPAEQLLVGIGLHAAVGQGRRHQRQVAHGHRRRTLADVALHRRGRIPGQTARGVQQVREPQIAVPGRQLGGGQRLVDLDRPLGQVGEEAEQAVDRRSLPVVDERVDGDRARVDHRVARPAGLGIQRQLVEGLAAGLHPHPVEDVVDAPVLDGQRVGEGLGHRLDAEQVVGVAARVHGPVDRADRDRHPVGVGGGQLRDVVGRGPGDDVLGLGDDRVEVVEDR